MLRERIQRLQYQVVSWLVVLLIPVTLAPAALPVEYRYRAGLRWELLLLSLPMLLAWAASHRLDYVRIERVPRTLREFAYLGLLWAIVLVGCGYAAWKGATLLPLWYDRPAASVGVLAASEISLGEPASPGVNPPVLRFWLKGRSETWEAHLSDETYVAATTYAFKRAQCGQVMVTYYPRSRRVVAVTDSGGHHIYKDEEGFYPEPVEDAVLPKCQND